jgi:tetratricopeptide (TPR) repeat protein
LPAWAQTKQQIDWCYSPTATDDQTILGCAAMIKSGRYKGTELSHAYNNRASGYSGEGQTDLAIADENLAIKLDPKNAEAYNNCCNDLETKSLYDQTISDCSQAIALKPDYGRAYLNRGIAYAGKQQYDLAIAHYGHAIRFNPNDALNYNERGIS